MLGLHEVKLGRRVIGGVLGVKQRERSYPMVIGECSGFSSHMLRSRHGPLCLYLMTWHKSLIILFLLSQVLLQLYSRTKTSPPRYSSLLRQLLCAQAPRGVRPRMSPSLPPRPMSTLPSHHTPPVLVSPEQGSGVPMRQRQRDYRIHYEFGHDSESEWAEQPLMRGDLWKDPGMWETQV